MAKITVAELQRSFGQFRNLAQREAVMVTHHGRDDVVLLSVDEYRRLQSLDTRRARHVSELTDEELALFEEAKPPIEAARYDHELS
ncbi:MAG: prevent-host-death family protein [Gammaproteobacteria bacterium]|jgi:prevent-host-death family protein